MSVGVWPLGRSNPSSRPNNLTAVAMLSLSCATREELSARLSALADTLNSLDIPETRLPELPTAQRGALNRLQECLKKYLDEAEYPACEHAITVLRAVNDLRVSFQHSVTAHNLLTVCTQLLLPFPLLPVAKPGNGSK